ncbi:hypothetical protein ITP53_00155 [Nonomuraea sp. K274]|uniref:Uncharacterized protein n=1 Tax=Nonomuraea cypriaca TaxID=1187855 RepID=A0A931A6B4_9ACTN|nr:hypothetical protein [Nonomuraea cypriaca]MBF8184184.1 hypothetical protein [Nonomuraea cypriaca]
MFDEIVARYQDILGDLDAFAYTVTLPDSGVLATEDAVRRLGFDPSALRGHGKVHSPGTLHLYQTGAGIVTLDWTNPGEDRQEVTNRLAGTGFQHWYVSFDIEGNTSMYVRYGETEGDLDHPGPSDIPFSQRADRLGPLSKYRDCPRPVTTARWQRPR